MAPLDLGDVGGAVAGAAETAVGGAKGVVETATSGGAGAAKTAAGAVATATNAVNDVKGKYEDAKGMLGMFTKMQDLITKIQNAWDKYQYLIIFVVCLIIFLYITITIYCCYHFIHDFFRCACCCVRCTYKCEQFLWKHREGICTRMLCKPCVSSDDKKKANHSCSALCLKTVPRSTRMELEKQHGDLRRGWFDPTYLGRSCGRFELPEDPGERAKWHWYGHEDQRIHRVVGACLPTENAGDRREAEEKKQQRRARYWGKLMSGVDKLGAGGSWTKRVNGDFIRAEEERQKKKEAEE
ncbi:hypothetical protein I302_102030 [Kwoniella bestiolae CBS 10118]|uniref:Uncharacterized protein n=1 Tax=Kwoniella bestiolae CBS 10118 TaxID=1296100 RepID=A0A1B9GDZ3_9TREE|nr:hypothetical protein I302_00714 [Kwoniella bestiolae CBS 10118]OCF29218.1 hypothetical protein I302_00714 [Kwoniella bestiolae CBS 10118]